MAAAPAVIVLLSLLFISWGCNAQDTHALLLTVIDAIGKLIQFYKADYQNMNLDGIYGLKIVEGQIQRILDEHRQGKHAALNPSTVQQLETLLHESKWVGEHAIASVNTDKQYQEKLAVVFTQPWTHFKQHRKISPTLRWEIPVYQSGVRYKINETQSNQCMMEITQQSKAQVKGGFVSKCSMSDHCALVMTKRGLTEYSITHQILWTALAEKVGCGTDMNILLKRLGFRSTDDMQEEFCTNNYYEMLAVVHVFMMGRVKESYQDIFLEQQFVCPSLGFFEFLKKDYLDQILSWQLPSGCFGTRTDSEDDSALQSHYQQKHFPKADENRLKVHGEVKNLHKIDNSNDLKKGQKLKNLKSNNQLHESLLRLQDKQKVDNSHQQYQKLDIKENAVPENKADFHPQLPVNNERNTLHMNQGFNVPFQPDNFHRDTVVKFPNEPQNILQDKISNKMHGIVLNKPQNNLPIGDGLVLGQNQDQEARLHGSMNGANAQAVQGEPNNGRAFMLKSGMVSKEQPAFRVHDRLQDPPLPVLAPNHLQKEMKHGRKLLTSYVASRTMKRKLLAEKEMSGGCLARKTGVAAGALVMYLRYLIDPGPLDLFAPHDFFPEKSRNLLGGERSHKAIMNFLSDQMHNSLDDSNRQPEIEKMRPGANENEKENAIAVDDDEEDQEEEEEEEEEDEEYDDRDELYPDTGGGVGQQQERKVVRFGANDEAGIKVPKEYYDDKREEENDEYMDENEDEEEEEGADYIKRVKGDGEGAGNEKDRIDDDTEYTYYDDGEDDNERGIVKRYKPQAPPQTGARIRAHNRHKPHPPIADSASMDQADSPPTKAVVVLLSATSLLLIIFMYRFLRKRRIHLRYHNRGFLKL